MQMQGQYKGKFGQTCWLIWSQAAAESGTQKPQGLSYRETDENEAQKWVGGQAPYKVSSGLEEGSVGETSSWGWGHRNCNQSHSFWRHLALREEGRECLQAPGTFVPSRTKSFETREESGVDREKVRNRLACTVTEASFCGGVRSETEARRDSSPSSESALATWVVRRINHFCLDPYFCSVHCE